MQCVNCKLFVDLWIAWVSSCPCCLLDTTIVLPELPAFNLFICLCWPQTPCLQHHTTVLHSAVLPITAAASSPSYHISTNVGRRQPLPSPAWVHITISTKHLDSVCVLRSRSRITTPSCGLFTHYYQKSISG